MNAQIVSARDGYGEVLKRIGGENQSVCVLDADLSCATMTMGFAEAFPERFFNVGISEQDLVGTAAGLSLAGAVPIASSFALFLTGRAYDQIRNSVVYPGLNVKLIASHAGLMVGRDGASHQSFEDISLMRGLPNMTIISPADYFAAQSLVEQAVRLQGPVYCRLSRLKSEPVYTAEDAATLKVGNAHVHKYGKGVAILSHGILLEQCLAAATVLESDGIHPTVIDFHTVKPLDSVALLDIAASHHHLVTVEDHSIVGGLGSAVGEYIAELEISSPPRLRRIGIRDRFGESGDEMLLLEKYKMNAEHIAAVVKSVV